MALEVLYGPSDITVGGVTAANISGGFGWVQGIGLLTVLQPSGGGYGLFAVEMDGMAQGPRSSFTSGGYGSVLDLRSARGFAVQGFGSLWGFDYIAGQPSPLPLLTGSLGVIEAITVDGRYLQFNGGGVKSSPDGITFTTEYAWTAPDASSFQTVSRGRSATELCVLLTNNQLRFYDTAAKRQSGSSLFIGESSSGCWYVPKYDIFVELKSGQLKILADVTAPYSLSNPVPSPAIAAGLTSQMSVQLLGVQSEPCVGELINWSIGSGNGSLAVPQSTTDTTGTATNTYICPVGSSGSVVIDAQMNY